ncbi:MAG TPA: hypothetical protein VFH78_07960 [Candidatus Thermoplasmatota archaeon]|nr:hypothetical protein [Candidatus Thermoplasmatota archaeon]
MRAFAATLLCLALVAGAAPALAHVPGGSQTASCQGPTLSVCTTGLHLRTDGTLSHGFAGFVGASYTGSLESRLTWQAPDGSSGERSFRCTYANGAVTGSCASTGALPPLGSVFVHTCYSYVAHTTTLGGTGAWGCSVSHA